MNEFEVYLPLVKDLNIDIFSKDLYNYDFSSYSLSSLQKAAILSVNNKITESIYSYMGKAGLLDKLVNNNGKEKKEYVAKLSEYAQAKLNSGEWQFGIKKKTGEAYAVLKDVSTGKFQSSITLEERLVNNLGSSLELSAIQGQLATIVERLDELNRSVERVEQGQYNDRYAVFFSARQMIIEGLTTSDKSLREQLLFSVIKTNNDTIAKLMLAVYHDSINFVNPKTEKKEADRINIFLQQSMTYLNLSVQLNVIAYTILGEKQPIMACLANYNAFIQQTLLKEIGKNKKSIAWKIDNASKGDSGNVLKLTEDISEKISNLLETNKLQGIEGEDYEKLGNKKMQMA
ncbi:hypothetical protein [Streptococcus oricebi]|uniref:Uncharacterized protein n=1 Tax=Streptococcus oricebi TaxID=1547447 RepID=A0ABS5B3Q2_9STRE|nr:hypothetical protein [Streptococcus oricebi]MBP2623088.1 hypothetical protein [Streptococcus oricebi]